ncbi:MAG: molybdopterin synthase catalytic subunit MoaE [Gammaproteobacteria bacterium]|nr:molybdopterin synthase catalytic subunit MoaE [Gammaproteobacteria bacterium]
MHIQIQPDDFDLSAEYGRLRRENPQAGAVVTFTGLVRDFNAGGEVAGIVLEHYSGMTEKTLQRIADEAVARWSVAGVTIIHRVGALGGAEQIVLVGVASRHRREGFAAAEFIMDFLKTEAPFWKRERSPDGEQWVDAKDSDQRARERW